MSVEPGNPNTLATPEGDNEATPDSPLIPEPAPIRPPGDEPHSIQPIRPAD